MPRTAIQKQRAEETRGLSLMEDKTMATVLRKKQREHRKRKSRAEGYEPCEVELERIIPIRASVLKEEWMGVPSPYLAFCAMFSAPMINEWRTATNVFLVEKGINTMTKQETFIYMGMVIKMMLNPLDEI